jgi:hypothetical protein
MGYADGGTKTGPLMENRLGELLGGLDRDAEPWDLRIG